QNAIKQNIITIDTKLSQHSDFLSDALRININEKIKIDNLTWEDPIANQILSDDSIIVTNLPSEQQVKFMEPANKMFSELPEIIQNQCYKFVTNYRKKQSEQSTLIKILTHDKQWKEKEKKLKKITKN